MSVTLTAHDLSAPHEKALVLLVFDVLLADWSPEAWPPGAGLELRIRTEQVVATTNALIDSFLMVVPVLARERPLGSFLSRNRELFGR